LGRVAFSPAVGLLLSALLSVDPLFVATDSQARMYSLWLFSATMVAFAVMAIDQRRVDPPVGLWLLLGLSLSLAFWVHILGVYLWLAAILALGIGHTRTRGDLLTFMKGLALSFSVVFLICFFRLYGVLRLLKHAMLGQKEYQPHLDGQGLGYALVNFAGTQGVVLVFCAGIAGLLILRRARPMFALYLLVLLPAALFSLFVLRQAHFLAGRYLYPLFISMYLGISILFVLTSMRLLRISPRLGIGITILVVLSCLGMRVSQCANQLRAALQGSDDRYEGSTLLQFVKKHASPSDTIVLIPPLLADQAAFYRLQGRVLKGNMNGNAWGNGYGYRTDDITNPIEQNVWIVTESSYECADWQNVTTSEKRKIVSRSLAMDESLTPMRSLAGANIIKIANGKLWVARASDVWAELNEAAPSALKTVVGGGTQLATPVSMRSMDGTNGRD
jgi:hypothetical protein